MLCNSQSHWSSTMRFGVITFFVSACAALLFTFFIGENNVSSQMPPRKPSAKRAAPANVVPIDAKNMIITPHFENKDSMLRVSVKAVDKTTNQEIWTTQLYSRAMNPDLEKDVQEIHLKKMTLKNASISAIDEKGAVYVIDSQSGKLISPATAKVYPAAK